MKFSLKSMFIVFLWLAISFWMLGLDQIKHYGADNWTWSPRFPPHMQVVASKGTTWINGQSGVYQSSNYDFAIVIVGNSLTVAGWLWIVTYCFSDSRRAHGGRHVAN